MRTWRALGAALALGVAGWGVSGCGSNPINAKATAATCSAAFKNVGSIPSDDTSSIRNEQKLQIIIDECPSQQALNDALVPYIPAGQDRQQATAQADQTFSDVCSNITGVGKAPLCAALG